MKHFNALAVEKIHIEDFNRFFWSSDNFQIDNIDFDKIFIRVIQSIFRTHKIQDFLFPLGFDLQPHHCYRHPLTHERLLRQGYKPSKTSQHRVATAIDCCVWKRINNTETLCSSDDIKTIGDLLWNNRLNFEIVQIKIYNTFIHIGFKPNDSDRKVAERFIG